MYCNEKLTRSAPVAQNQINLSLRAKPDMFLSHQNHTRETDRLKKRVTLLISGHMGSGKSVLRKTLHVPPAVVIIDDLRCFHMLNVPYHRHVRGLNSQGKNHNFGKAGVRWGFVYYLLLLRFRTLLKKHIRAGDVQNVLTQIFPQSLLIGDVANHYQHTIARTAQLTGFKQVIVYRDCRDVVAEMRRRFSGVWRKYSQVARKPDWVQCIETPRNAAQHWRERIELMEAHQDMIYSIRYEALVADPAAVLCPLAQWLGISADLIRYDFIHTDRIGDYQDILTEKEVADVMDIAGPTMERLGYL